MTTAVLIFHQGYTDIINSLGLISYYAQRYNTLNVLMRNEAKNMLDFFIKDKSNVIVTYIEHDDFEIYREKYQLQNVYLSSDDKLLIGYHDHLRKDKYVNKFHLMMKSDKHHNFVRGFYKAYDIGYQNRFDGFVFERDYNRENEMYNQIIGLNTEYVLVHDTEDLPIELNNTILKINLNKISDTFFDMIKVIENAREIHVIDSVWGVFIYLLDVKYRLCQNIKVYVYLKRKHKYMFDNPLLPNWILK